MTALHEYLIHAHQQELRRLGQTSSASRGAEAARHASPAVTRLDQRLPQHLPGSHPPNRPARSTP